MSHTVPLAMAVPAVRSLGRLAANNCYFFLCDMQEKFRPSIRYFPEIITVAQRMVSHGRKGVKSVANTWQRCSMSVPCPLLQVTAANILDIPVIATEQYPKGEQTIHYTDIPTFVECNQFF